MGRYGRGGKVWVQVRRYGRCGEGLGTSGGMVGVGKSGYEWGGMVHGRGGKVWV